MGDNKKKGVVKETIREFYSVPNHQKLIASVKEKIKKGEYSEEEFLSSYRLLTTYEERKKVLTNRDYSVVEDNWQDNLNNNEQPNFYYKTFTITNIGNIEHWIKRKTYKDIRNILLTSSKICENNPYTSFTVKDDKGNDQTFFKKR